MKFYDLEAAEIAAKYVQNTNKHIFLTGKAGTGKTTFLREIIRKTHKNAVIAAPTGIAAINAGGVTLHSLFQLPFGSFLPNNGEWVENPQFNFNTPHSLISKQQINSSKRKLLAELELLIIDEVSMLRSDLLDAIDTVLRHVRRKPKLVFGGVQVLFIGDMLQLPPVVKNQEWEVLSKYYPSVYFFDARCLRDNPPVYIELEKVYRQTDEIFISLLNRLRNNIISDEDRQLLNRFYDETFSPEPNEGYIYITTHNIKANKKNQYELDRLPSDSYFYSAYSSGEFDEHNYPHLETLELKEGAQVMFIKNDPTGQQRFFNGKIGFVTYLDKDTIQVQCQDGENVEVERYEWENKRYTLNKSNNEIEEKVVGSFAQYPLRLAWAITVHKSQGLTFDKAILDLTHSFSPGQVYVALSRLTSLNGLMLTSPLPEEEFQNDSALTGFISNRPNIESLERLYNVSSEEFLIESVGDAFSMEKIITELFFLMRSYTHKEKKLVRSNFQSWGASINTEVSELHKVGRKFHYQSSGIIQSDEENKVSLLYERIQKAYKYFSPRMKEIKKKVSDHIKEVKSNKKLKSYVNDLKKLEDSFFAQEKMMVKLKNLISSILNEENLTKEDLLKDSFFSTNSIQKKDKTPTKLISYNFYKEGLSVEEIAEKRGLVPGTIANHLTDYVRNGQLDIHDFVSSEKVKNILKVMEKAPDNQLGTIKSFLGEEYSYSDVRFVLAMKEAENS